MLKVFVFTYNTHDSKNILNLIKETVDKPDYDLIYIALQENFSTVMYTNIVKMLKKTCTSHKFIQSEKLIGLSSFVISKHRTNHKSLKLGLGLSGFPNKGFIAHKINDIIFVNCHLQAHEGNQKKRLEMFKIIVDFVYECYDNFETIIFAGDFNFRCENFDSDYKNKEYEKYKAKDEFIELVKHFPKLNEGKISFPPTFKFIVGSNEYDLKRSASWCDRIIYASNNDVNINEYGIIHTMFSDHRPVYAGISIKFTKNNEGNLLCHKKVYFLSMKIIVTRLYCFIYENLFIYILFLSLIVFIILFKIKHMN